MKQPNAFPLFLLLLGMFGGATFGRAQSLFQTVKPEVLVLVKKHPSGADIVEISVIAPRFPPELLQERATAICQELKYGPHGLQVFRTDIGTKENPMQFLKASFGTNGLIDSATGVLRLQAIARAFAGIPAPNTIHGLSVTFDAVKPTSQTLQKYQTAAISLEAQYNPPPASGLEYRILLTSQDAGSIVIPERAEPKPSVKASETKADVRGAPAWITWLLLLVTAFAFGALVYFGFLRLGAKRR